MADPGLELVRFHNNDHYPAQWILLFLYRLVVTHSWGFWLCRNLEKIGGTEAEQLGRGQELVAGGG